MNELSWVMPVSIDNMFDGKNLPLWLEAHRYEMAMLIDKFGREMFDKVYDFFFRYMSRMKWGQWMVVEKVCPKEEMRQLFFFVVEMIYQSDCLSRYHFVKVDDELRIVVDAPSEHIQKKCSFFLGDNCYILVDWYARLRANHKANPDIKPEWIGFEQERVDDDDIKDDYYDE